MKKILAFVGVSAILTVFAFGVMENKTADMQPPTGSGVYKVADMQPPTGTIVIYKA